MESGKSEYFHVKHRASLWSPWFLCRAMGVDWAEVPFCLVLPAELASCLQVWDQLMESHRKPPNGIFQGLYLARFHRNPSCSHCHYRLASGLIRTKSRNQPGADAGIRLDCPPPPAFAMVTRRTVNVTAPLRNTNWGGQRHFGPLWSSQRGAGPLTNICIT